ncbi:MAG: WG repeat-containing protein [Bacteroidales bacterium]|nr:WG repeat-containing protein [Bacteroidales bacterium]
MKRIYRYVSLIMILASLFGCGLSTKVPEGFTARSEKSIEKLCKTIPIRSGLPKYVSCWRFSVENEEVYLKTLPEEKRSKIENNLLNRYKEVIILARTPQWYYVVDNDNSVGIYNLDGSLFCPPLPGTIKVMIGGFNFMIIGDSLGYEEFQKQYDQYLRSGSGAPTGSCLAVVNWVKGRYIIPYGNYVDIAFARKIGNNHYYVAQYNAEGALKWGICNHNGKLEVPCEYESVGVKGGMYLIGGAPVMIGGKFIGRNDVSMYDLTRNSRERYARAKARGEVIAGIMMSVGETMVSVAELMPGEVSSSPSGRGNNVSHNSAQLNSTGSSTSSRSELSSFNTDRDTYNSCVRLLINMSSNSAYDYSDTVRKDTQRQMKHIREKWAKKGHIINQSTWETWGGK